MTAANRSPRPRRRRPGLALGAAALVLAGLARASATRPGTERRQEREAEPRSVAGEATERRAEAPPRSRRRRRHRGRVLAATAVVLALTAVGLGLGLGVSSSQATVDWSSGFENQSWSPWQGLQHNENEPLSNSFQFVTDPVRTGSYAAKFIVRQGEGPAWGLETTELCCGPDGEGTPGTEHWWAWSTYFPTDWSEPYHWGLFFQLHAGDDMPPAISFDAGADAAWVNIRAGQVDPSKPSWSYGNYAQILNTLSKGHWNDFVLHVRWSVTDGQVQVWHRLAGETTFTPVLDLNHIPTLQQYSSGKIAGIYTKLGLYRDSYCTKPIHVGCTSPLGTQPTSTLYDDSFVRGSSFDEVTNAAWGSSSAAPAATPPAPAPSSSPPAPAPAAPPSAPAPSSPAPSTPAPSTPASAPSAPTTTTAGNQTGSSPPTAPTQPVAGRTSKIGPAVRSAAPATQTRVRLTRAKTRAQAAVRAQTQARARTVARATTRARAYTRAGDAAAARAHAQSLSAAAARAKARAYYRAAAREWAKVRTLTWARIRPIPSNPAVKAN